MTNLGVEEYKRRQKLLKEAGYNVRVDGNWGSWQEQQWNNYTKRQATSNGGGGLYTQPRLLQMVRKLGHQARIDNRGRLVTMPGAPLVYDYQQKRFMFKDSKGTPQWLLDNGNFGHRKEPKDFYSTKYGKALEYPSLYQTVSEDQAFVKNRFDMDQAAKIPYIPSREHIVAGDGISKGAPISMNVIDSIVANLMPRDRRTFLGISSSETNIGKAEPYTFNTSALPSSVSAFRDNGYTTPASLSNDHTYFIGPSRGALNYIFKNRVKKMPALRYGAPGYFYTIDDITPIGTSQVDLGKADATLEYQRQRGTFDPTKMKVGSDYYDPEDNPYQHAINNFQHRNYGMGGDYVSRVNNNTKDIDYLLK